MDDSFCGTLADVVVTHTLINPKGKIYYILLYPILLKMTARNDSYDEDSAYFIFGTDFSLWLPDWSFRLNRATLHM